MSNFYALTDTDAIKPGQLQRFTLGNVNILLANVDGNFYAVEDLCSHEDAVLSRGALKGKCIECPLHGSRFDLSTGRPMEEPATEAIKTYPLEVKEKTIYITLDNH